MQASEKILYLRNIVALARSDGELAPQENAFTEETRCLIGANKTQLKKALSGIEGHKIDLKPIARLSDRIRNLEDMVGAALADGRLQDEEKHILIKVAKAVCLSQDLVNLIVVECKQRRKSTAKRCPSCSAEATPAAEFCPACGTNLDERTKATQKLTEFKIPASGLTLTFAKSTAAGFDEAVRLAKMADDYQEVVKGSKEWYGCKIPKSDAAAALRIAHNLKGMRNRSVFVDGKECTWNEVFGFVWCPREREGAFDPTKYCYGVDDGQFNPWGCKQLNMAWDGNSDWLTYGQFIGTDVFEFDQERISHELQQKLAGVQFCPHLQRDFIRAVLEQLPDRVKVGYGTDWDYREAYEPDPRAVEMEVVRDYDGEKETERIKAIGIEPRSSKLAIKMINEAANACGLPTVGDRLSTAH